MADLLFDLRVALPAWLLARVIVLPLLALARWVVTELHATPADPINRLQQGLFAWDGGVYGSIAIRGYHGVPLDWLRFFPLYPLSGRWFGKLLGSSDVALLALSNGFALLAAALLHRLALQETGDVRLAERAAWLFSLAPPAFVLVLAYSEGLFVAVTVAAFLAIRNRRFGWAILPGLLAGLSRPTGLLLAVPIAVEASRTLRQARLRDRLVQSAAVLAPLIGAGWYLAWVGSQFGDPLLPFRLQSRGNAHGPYSDPLTIVRGIWNGWGGPQEFSHLPWVVLVLLLLVILARRWPVSYVLFAGLCMASAFTSLNLNSWERYALGTFPLVLAVAQLTRGPIRERVALLLSVSLLVCYTLVMFTGLYVP